MVPNELPPWFPERRVGERRVLPSRRHGAGVSLLHLDLARVIASALDQAALPTSRSSSLYLALAAVRKRLLTEDPAPPPVAQFVPEIEGLVALCTGKLAAIRPMLEEALRIAR